MGGGLKGEVESRGGSRERVRREKSRMVWFEGERPRVEISRVLRGCLRGTIRRVAV